MIPGSSLNCYILPELAPNLDNDILGGFADGPDGPASEEEDGGGAKQAGEEDLGDHDVDVFEFDLGDEVDLIDEGSEQ